MGDKLFLKFLLRGDPDKCDHYGNTPLHCASGSGHSDCVSFLVHFGVNLWALDNDFHTAKDVAVLAQKHDVLRMLDQAQSRHALVNRKLVQRLKEKSVDDAEKRVKRYRKMQDKAAKRAEKEERERAAARKENRSTHAPKFSDLVNSGERRETTTPQRPLSTDRRKKTVVFRPGDILRRDSDPDLRTCDSRMTRSDSTKVGRTPSPDTQSSDDADSDVLQTADSGIGDEIPDGQVVGIFDRPGFGTVSFRNPVLHLSAMDGNRNLMADLHNGSAVLHNRNADLHIESTDFHSSSGDLHGRNADFHSRNADLHNGNADLHNRNADLHCRNADLHNGSTDFHSRNADLHNRNAVLHCRNTITDSIGSASSLVRRHITWEDEEEDDEEEEEGSEEDLDLDREEEEPLSLLLAAVGLSEYLPLFRSEQIDLEALSLLSEEDLKALGMPLGPRRKLGRAVQERIKILQEPGVVHDSPL